MTPVEFQFNYPDGEPIANAEFVIKLPRSGFIDAIDGVIMPATLVFTTDALGMAIVSLAPSSSVYTVRMSAPLEEGDDGLCHRGINYKFYVPNTTEMVRAQDLFLAPPPNSEPWDETAIRELTEAKIVAVNAAETATAAADVATDAAARAEAAADGIDEDADRAELARDAAIAAATESQGSADAAALSASLATDAATQTGLDAAHVAADTLIVVAAKDEVLANADVATDAAERAEASAVRAAASETSADGSATAAVLSETNAAESATTATSAKDIALAQASISTNAATAAAASETSAEQSAADASVSKNSATASATTATSEATEAAASALAALNSQTAAKASETNAKASETAALPAIAAGLRFCGVAAIAPTTRTNGTPLQVADEYQNSTDNLRYQWTGAAWVALNSSAQQLETSLALPEGSEKSGYRDRNTYLKLSDWVATADFAGTDTESLVSAEAYCFANGKTLHIDKSLFLPLLAAPVDLRCGVIQQPGTVISISNTGVVKGVLRFVSAQTGTVLTGVGGLVEGGTKLTGLPAASPGSWLLITSTEELIKDTSANFYVKQEVATIADILGGLRTPLNATYTNPVITLFNPETPLIVEGINIKGDGGEIVATTVNLVEFYRRGAHVTDLNISGVPNRGSQVKFNQTPASVLENPSIVGHTVGNGYGVLAFMTENLAISNPQISNCRHAYSARHDKNTMIVGGSLSEMVDSHWGQNLIIMGSNIIGQVQYAGRDLSVTGCTQTPKDYCIRVRNTSPELKGRVQYENNTVNVDSTVMAGTHFAYMTFGLSSGTYDFGRNLKQPDLVTVAGNTLNIISAPTDISYFRMLTASGFAYDLSTRFEVARNVRNGVPKTINILSGFTKADNVTFSKNPVIKVEGENNCRVSITSVNTTARIGEGFSLELINIAGFILFAAPNTLADSTLTNVASVGWALPSGGAQAQVDNGRLKQSGASFSGALPVEFSRIMSGEVFFRSMPGDTASYFRTGKDFGHLSVVTQNSLSWSGIMAYDVQASGAFNMTISAGSNFASSSGILTGVTGTDTFLTLSATTLGRVYVENRAGAALTIQIKELNFG